MPWEPGVSITPLPGLHRTAYMTEAIDDAQATGAEVVNEGGGSYCQTLFYPAVVYPVREGMKLYREEQFGPIVPVMAFDDVEEALDYVITSDHGQQVSIFGTRSGSRSARWSIRWSTRSAASTSTASASAGRTSSRSPAARTRPRARCRWPTRCARSRSARWSRPSRPRPASSCSTPSSSDHRSKFVNTGFIL